VIVVDVVFGCLVGWWLLCVGSCCLSYYVFVVSLVKSIVILR